MVWSYFKPNYSQVFYFSQIFKRDNDVPDSCVMNKVKNPYSKQRKGFEKDFLMKDKRLWWLGGNVGVEGGNVGSRLVMLVLWAQ